MPVFTPIRLALVLTYVVALVVTLFDLFIWRP